MTRITCLKCDSPYSCCHRDKCEYGGKVLAEHCAPDGISDGVFSCHYCTGPTSFNIPYEFRKHKKECRFEGPVKTDQYIHISRNRAISVPKTILIEILKDVGYYNKGWAHDIEYMWPKGELVGFYDNECDMFHICTKEVYEQWNIEKN